MTTAHVSVVLPVANQADHISRIVPTFIEALGELPEAFELILVVNASSDGSLEVCRQLAESHQQVETIESPPGWGQAVIAGLAAAQGDLLCYTNSARTDPADLLQLIRYGLVNEQVAVKASRKVRESLSRRLGSVVYNFECRMLFGLAVWDINGTPKILPRSAYARLDVQQTGDLIDIEIMSKCKRLRVPIVEVPVYPTARHGGRSTTNLRSAARMYTGALRMYLRDRASARN